MKWPDLHDHGSGCHNEYSILGSQAQNKLAILTVQLIEINV